MTIENGGLTAEAMREVALHSEHAITPELEVAIREAARNGKLEVAVDGELMKETIQALMHRGFTVETTYNNFTNTNVKNTLNESPSYTIGWV